jgi:hypothetical protein
MKKLVRLVSALFAIFTLSLVSPANSYASGGTIPIVFTPLPSGTTVPSTEPESTYTSTENAPSGPWTSTINAGDDIKVIFYELSLESLGSCSAGTGAEITSINLQTTASGADPVDNDDSTGVAIGPFTLGIDYDLNGDPTFVETDSGIASATLNLLSVIDGGNKTLTTSLFSTAGLLDAGTLLDGATLKAAVFHFAEIEQGDFTVTSSFPSGSVKYACTSDAFVSDGGSAPKTPPVQPSSPKTGAGEVLLALSLVVLAASSFVIYKAIHKHRNTGKLSEK